jgi:small ligand-binding sensory domain FIST
MNEFASAHATGADAMAVARTLAQQLDASGGHNVGFLYVTSPLAQSFEGLVAALRQTTGIETWIGTVGHGVCGSGAEYWAGPAATVLSCQLAKESFRLIPSTTSPAAARSKEGPVLAAGFGVVHGDPRNAGVTDIVATLSRERGAYLVGGLSSANSAFPQVAGDRIVDGGVSGLLIGGRLTVAVGLTQGCSPIGPVHEVTRGEGQILATLDGQRAYDILCEDVGVAEGADPRPWLANVHAALPVAGSSEADYVVRNLVGIDPRQGLVAIAESLSVGDKVMFVRRDRASAEKDLGRMLSGLEERLTGRPKAGLYFSCVARGPNLFEDTNHEMRAIRDTFGDIPIAGFFGNGEISSDRVYGYTGVLALFT